MEKTDEIAVALKRFGDEESTLLDKYERLSFEVRLNQAILGRSLSEPSVPRTQPPLPLPASPPLVKQVRQGKRPGAGFQKVLKKLLKPILGRKGAKTDVSNPKDPRFWKTFSRSVRV